MKRSLYKIPPGCICQGDGLLGMACDAPTHATLKDLPELAYDFYCESTGGRSAVTGDLLPEFDATNQKVQDAWKFSIGKVLEEYERRRREDY